VCTHVLVHQNHRITAEQWRVIAWGKNCSSQRVCVDLALAKPDTRFSRLDQLDRLKARHQRAGVQALAACCLSEPRRVGPRLTDAIRIQRAKAAHVVRKNYQRCLPSTVQAASHIGREPHECLRSRCDTRPPRRPGRFKHPGRCPRRTTGRLA
jgi:hypothetical protein